MRFRRSLSAVAVLLCAASGVLHGQSTLPPPRTLSDVLFGVTRSRDTVTVGEPFEIRVRVRAPLGATIRFPDNPDTSGAVQARDPRVIVTSDSVRSLDQVATYHVAAWDIGRQLAVFRDVVVTFSSAERRVPLTNIAVQVQTVLPLDSALRVPKPARPLWETPPFPWWILAILALAMALAIWWWWRRLRRRKPARPVPSVDPYVRAVADFERIEVLGLLEAGERTRFVSLTIEVLRDYLASRYPDARLALTSRELVAALRRTPAVSAEALNRVLHDADLAKFAAIAIADERARGVWRDARAIVEKEHTVSKSQAATQAAA